MLSPLLRYYHDCVAAQLDWSQAINVLDRKGGEVLGLTVHRQRDLAADGKLTFRPKAAQALAQCVAASGWEAWRASARDGCVPE